MLRASLHITHTGGSHSTRPLPSNGESSPERKVRTNTATQHAAHTQNLRTTTLAGISLTCKLRNLSESWTSLMRKMVRSCFIFCLAIAYGTTQPRSSNSNSRLAATLSQAVRNPPSWATTSGVSSFLRKVSASTTPRAKIQTSWYRTPDTARGGLNTRANTCVRTHRRRMARKPQELLSAISREHEQGFLSGPCTQRDN